MDRVEKVGIWLLANWERVFFVAVGLAFLVSSFRFVHNDNVTEAAIVFGLSFLCFLYANVARFKRFKGLGFEAELWEDKKKEAADLIERLKSVVEIYTREAVMSRVTRMRSIEGPNWEENWSLFDSLAQQHNDLGQEINFSTLKKEVDDFFLFDLCHVAENKIRKAMTAATISAREIVYKQFDDPLSDIDNYNKRMQQASETEYGHHADDFSLSRSGNLAAMVIERYKDREKKLSEYFGIKPDLDLEMIRRLERLSELYMNRPVEVTPELIEWSKER